MIDTLKNYSTIKMFGIYCLYAMALTYLQHLFLMNDQLYYHALADQLSYSSIEKMLSFQRKWQWTAYCAVPLLYFIKFLLVSCCLLSGAIFFNVKLKFSEAFKISLLSDVVFMVPIFLKLIWFTFFHKDYTLEDIQRFSPLSAINFFDTKSISALWYYPLESINLFEVVYIFVLGFWIYKFGGKNYDKGLKLAVSTYLPGLLIWIVLVMFLTININPKI